VWVVRARSHGDRTVDLRSTGTRLFSRLGLSPTPTHLSITSVLLILNVRLAFKFRLSTLSLSWRNISILTALSTMIPHGARRAMHRINEQAMNENEQADTSETHNSNLEVLSTPLMIIFLDGDTNKSFFQ
jgi:hypothetical protein